MSVAWSHLAATLQAPAPFDPGLEPEAIRAAVLRTCDVDRIAVERVLVHRFEPQGASLLFFGPALRLAVHTWPERGIATVDLHLAADPDPFFRSLETAWGWTRCECRDFRRKAGDER